MNSNNLNIDIDVKLSPSRSSAFTALKIVELYINQNNVDLIQSTTDSGEIELDFEDHNHHWVDGSESIGGHYHSVHWCSNCSFTTEINCIEQYNYCPSCGARMNEVDDEAI